MALGSCCCRCPCRASHPPLAVPWLLPVPWLVTMAGPRAALPRQTAAHSWEARQRRRMAADPPAPLLPPLLQRMLLAGSCCAVAQTLHPTPACLPPPLLQPPAAATAAGPQVWQCPHSLAPPCSCPQAQTHPGCAAARGGVGRCTRVQHSRRAEKTERGPLNRRQHPASTVHSPPRHRPLLCCRRRCNVNTTAAAGRPTPLTS